MRTLLLLGLAALAGCKAEPYETRKDVPRKAFASYACSLDGGRRLSVTLASAAASCKDARTGAHAAIALDYKKEGSPALGVPVYFGSSAPTRSLRCEGSACNPVWGLLTLSAFKRGGPITGSYDFQWANGAETGTFGESQWCPDEPACD